MTIQQQMATSLPALLVAPATSSAKSPTGLSQMNTVLNLAFAPLPNIGVRTDQTAASPAFIPMIRNHTDTGNRFGIMLHAYVLPNMSVGVGDDPQ